MVSLRVWAFRRVILDTNLSPPSRGVATVRIKATVFRYQSELFSANENLSRGKSSYNYSMDLFCPFNQRSYTEIRLLYVEHVFTTNFKMERSWWPVKLNWCHLSTSSRLVKYDIKIKIRQKKRFLTVSRFLKVPIFLTVSRFSTV